MKKGKRFISGIYNYCDYWCERCEFTRRCRNFAMGREIERRADDENVPDDAANAKFWSHLASKARDAAMSVSSESWQPDDWEDADFDIDPEWQAREDARRKAVDRHPLVVMAHEYMQRTYCLA